MLLGDDSESQVVYTQWGHSAREDISYYVKHVVLLLHGQMSDYNGGRSVSAGVGSSVMIDPVLLRANELAVWFTTISDSQHFRSLQLPIN